MKKVFTIVVILIAPFFQAKPSEPDETGWKYKVGLDARYNVNMHSADFRKLPGVPNCCPKFGSGTGSGYGIGALLEYGLPGGFFIGFRAGYSVLDAVLTKNEKTTFLKNGIITEGEFEHRIDADIDNLGIETLLGYDVWGGLSLNLGFRAGFNLSASYSQVETITRPLTGVTFLDTYGNDTHKKTRNESTGDIPGATSFQLFAVAGLSWDFPLTGNGSWLISPELFYHYSITNIIDSGWRANSLNIGAALKYTPVKMEDEFERIEEIDTVELKSPDYEEGTFVTGRPEIVSEVKELGNRIITTERYKRVDTLFHRKLFSLDAKINTTGVDLDGNETENPKLSVEEFITNRLDPLLNYIFFDENSPGLPARYRVLSHNETADFRVEKLYKDSTLGIYYHLLNIVGRRMTDYPEARLTLTGCNSNRKDEKWNRKLSGKRAETVRNYLVNTWNIDPARIAVEVRNLPVKASTPDDEPEKIEENRRVELFSDTYEILEPVFTTDTLRKSNLGSLRFKTAVVAEAGIDSWKMTSGKDGMNSSGGVVSEGNSENLPEFFEWKFKNTEDLPHLGTPLVYQFDIKDKRNNVFSTGRQTIPVEIMSVEKKRTERIGDVEVDKYSLILFEFDKADIEGTNSKIIDLIRSRIKPGSEIEIAGYTDYTGKSDYNKNLSQLRADAAKSAVGRSEVNALGMGEDTLLYNNGLPEGRFYCRTVVITIKTKL